MINLIMIPLHKEVRIVKIREKISDRTNQDRHLVNLGFVPGAVLSVVNEHQGNLIVNIKDTRVAIGKDIAKKIMVEEV